MYNSCIAHSIRRTGHARFRRGPADQSPNRAEENNFRFKFNIEGEPKIEECKSARSSISSELLFNAAESNYSLAKPPLPLSNRKKWREIKQCVNRVSTIFSSAKPPLPSSHRKRRREIELVSGDRLSCHCCQKRKKIEITRRIRIHKGSSSTSIPSDDYCWKKYEQKLIKRSSSRGGYYKCSSVTGCSARKHVIKDKNDPMVLIVTYKGEHNHRFP